MEPTLTPEKKVYILLNKPKNFTTALDEGQEYRNVLEFKGSTTAKIGRCRKNGQKHNRSIVVFTNDTDMIASLLYQVKNHLKSTTFR
jgi:23S rRNA pseudouridine2605 synthase